jgi:hypothetical protein
MTIPQLPLHPCKNNPSIHQSINPPSANAPLPAPTHTQEVISVSSNDNSSRLAELESSIQSINSERISFQFNFKCLQAEFQKVTTSALQHSKKIQAIQSDMRGLSSMFLELRTGLSPMLPQCFLIQHYLQCVSLMISHPLTQCPTTPMHPHHRDTKLHEEPN